MDYPENLDDVRSDYIMGRTQWSLVSDGEAGVEFDDYIAKHDREVRAQAYETLAADPHHGWAIATSLIDMAAVERGQMTQTEMDEKWGVSRD